MAAADITLATTDTIFALIEDELSKEFVETWSKIYLVGGALTAGPVLLNGIFKGGLKILDGTAKAEFKNFVRAFIFKVVIEKNIANFTKSTIKEILFVEQAIIADGIRIELAEITRLQKADAIFIKGIGFDVKVQGYAVIYKGEEIASGSAKEVRETLKDAWKASGNKLVEVLDKLPVTRMFKDIIYKIVREENYIEWIIKKSNLTNRARLFGGMLEFDFNTLGATKGLGQKFTSEAFEFFGKKIKKVKTEWRLNPSYLGGSSLGYKEYTNALKKFNGNKELAAKETTFYKTMSQYQFDKIDDILESRINGKLESAIILLKK